MRVLLALLLLVEESDSTKNYRIANPFGESRLIACLSQVCLQLRLGMELYMTLGIRM